MIGHPVDTASVLARTDFVRFGLGPSSRSAMKEWHHFVVHGDGRRIIINFSVCAEGLPARGSGADGSRPPVARVIVIIKDEQWTGVIERFDHREVEATGDGLSLRMGRSEVRINQGTYEVDLDLPSGIRGRLVLLPRARPFVVGNHGLGRRGRLSWLLLPRLEAHGWITAAGERLPFRDSPAYHDHNWGSFRWGQDFGWEWGSALPNDADDPWAIVFMRMTDRARHRALSQGLYVWHHDEMAAMFRDATTTVSINGFLARPPQLTLPPVMRFLTPGRASGVPAELVVTGNRGRDRLRLRFVPEDYIRIVIPSEVDLRRLVTLNEISGTVEAEGDIAGRPLSLGGSGVFELLA